MSSYNIRKVRLLEKIYKAGKQIKNPFTSSTEFNLPVRAQKALNKII